MGTIRSRRAAAFRQNTFALALVLVMLFSGASPSSASQSTGNSGITRTAEDKSKDSGAEVKTEVKIDNFAFTPAVITVKAGTQLTWINHDDIPHTVDSTEGKFKSAALDTDDKFQFRFTEPGEYPYYCRMHPKMIGKIIVQPQ